MEPLTAAAEDRLWVLRNVFLLLDVEFCHSFVRGILSELPLGKGNEFMDNFVLALGDKAIPFFASMLRVEVRHSANANDLTKHTSVSGKLLTSFMQLYTQDYFRKVLGAPITALCKAALQGGGSGGLGNSGGDSFDGLGGSKGTGSGGGAEQEVQGVIDDFTDLMDAIFNSEPQCPMEVKGALKILQEIVDSSKLRGGLKLVGFFFFERGWCSAIALPKIIFQDMEVDAKVYQRLQLLSKLFIDLVRKSHEKGPFASFLAQSDTSLIEFLANVCSNSDKGTRVIATARTPQQIQATKAFIDMLPLLTKPLFERSLKKFLGGESDMDMYQHCMHMFGLFKDVAVDIGIQPTPALALKANAMKNSKILSKKDLQKREALAKAIKNGDFKEFSSIAASQDGRAQLDSPTDDGSYPIIAASANRRDAIVKYLVLSAKVNVNVVDVAGMTAFTWASKNGTEDIISYLLSARPGVDVATSNTEGNTPLHFLLKTMPHYDALLLTVIDRGADVNAASKVGESILSHAVKHRCSYGIIQTIIERGADIDYRDAAGRTAYYWAQMNDYEPVQKLLASKGAQVPDATARRIAIQIDTCTCSGGLTISSGGTCAGCKKPRCRPDIAASDKTVGAVGFAKPWSSDQIKNEISGRSMEQRCTALGKKPPTAYNLTFHFEGKQLAGVRVPPNALGKFVLRRCQADTSVSFAWERGTVYSLSFLLVSPAGAGGGDEVEKREIMLDLESPLWIYDLDEHTDVYIKRANAADKKAQFYLKFVFPPHDKSIVRPVNPFQAPRSILTTTLIPHLPSQLLDEAPQRLGMYLHTDAGLTLINDQQPISTLNIINWDLISVRVRDAYEFECVDDPSRTILVERSLSVARVIDLLSNFLELGTVPTKVEELVPPLSQDIQNAFADEGITIPPSLVSKQDTPRDPAEQPNMRQRLRTAQSHFTLSKFQIMRGANGAAAGTSPRAVLLPEVDGTSGLSSWNTATPSVVKSSSENLTEPSLDITIPITRPSPPRISTSLTSLTSTPSSSAAPFPASDRVTSPHEPPSPSSSPTTPTMSSPPTPTSATSFISTNSFASAIANSISRKPSGSASNNLVSSHSANAALGVIATPPADPSNYVKQTARSMSKIVRNVPMWLFETTPLISYNLAANDTLEICDRVVVYPRDATPHSEKYTLVLPPASIKLRVKWASAGLTIPAPITSSLSLSSLVSSPSVATIVASASSSFIATLAVPKTSSAVQADVQALALANPQEMCIRNEAKLIFLGYSGAGKTALIRQLHRIRSLNDKEPLRDVSGIKQDKYMKADFSGVVKSEWKFVAAEAEASKYVFRTFELVGKEDFLFSQQFLISPGCIFVLVFNLLHPKDENIQNWLETIQTRAPDSAVIIVGTHSDSKEAAKRVNLVLDSMARRFCSKYTNIAGFTAVSSKTFKGIQKFAQLLLKVSREVGYVDSKLPISHAILAKLLSLSRVEAHKANSPPYITWEHIKSIGDRLGLWDKKLKDAMKYCMDISGTVYFGMDSSSPLADLVFLDNQWLPALMNSVIKCKPANNEGMVSHSNLCQIWKSPFFPSHIHSLLADLLNKFEVVFAQDEYHYLIPLLLPEEKPAAVKDLIPPFEPVGGTQSERIFEFGPMAVGFFSRLIARLLGSFDSLIYWRYGVVVTPHEQEGNNNSRAILEYVPTTYRLRMSVRNDKSGKLVRPLADSIMTFITTWFPGRLRRVLVTCAHCISNQSYDPFFFDLDDCERAAAQGKQYVMCRGVQPVRIDLLALDVTLNDQSTIPYDQITLQEKLGEGSFAFVYKGVWNGKVVAVKVINVSEDAESTEKFREFRKEALLMSGLQHPNIVSLRGICLKPLCLVAELLPLGDLHSFLVDPTMPMNWPLIMKIAMDIAKGMEFLHCSTPPVVHRDLKSPNILLGWTKERHVVAKVTDFGLSTRSNAGMVGRQVWNVSWLAPEIMKGHAYSTKVDVYSYGVVLWELLVRQKPFSEYDSHFKFDRQLEEEIEKGLRPTIPANCPPDYARLVRACWADLPVARPTFTEIIASLKLLEASRIAAGGETDMPEINIPIPTDLFDDDPSSTNNTPTNPSPITERAISAPNNSTPTALIFLDETNASEESDSEDEKEREREVKEEEDKKDEKVLLHKYNASDAPGSIQCMLSVATKGTYHVWVGCGDGSIVILDATRQRLHVLKHHSNRVCHMICIYRAKQEPVVWTASMDGTIAVIDSSHVNKPVKVLKIEKPITCLQEVGDCVWTGSFDGGLRIFDKLKYKLKKTLKSEGSAAIGCLFAPNDERVWVGTEKCIWIMDAKSFTFLQELEGHESMINAIKYVNNTIWSCSADKTIRVWSMDGEQLHVLQGHSGRVFCLLAVGSYVISGSWDKSMFVWDARTHTFLHEVAGYHTDSIGALTLVKNEIWSGSWDKTMCIFTLEDKPR